MKSRSQAFVNDEPVIHSVYKYNKRICCNSIAQSTVSTHQLLCAFMTHVTVVMTTGVYILIIDQTIDIKVRVFDMQT